MSGHDSPSIVAIRPVDRGLGWLLGALGAALLANTLVGPLVADAVDYPVTGTLLSQLLGLEVVTVLLVVPMALAGAVLLRRGRPLAPYLGIGAGSYTAYMFAQYVLGPSYTAYRPVVFLHLGIFTLGTAVAGWSWAVAVRTPPPAPSLRRRRWVGVLLLGLAAFVLTRYLPAAAGAATAAALPAEFAAAPAFFWSIVLLDLGLVVPATAAAGVGLLRGARAAVPASYAVVVWFALVPVSVAAMSVAMLARGDAEASLGQAVMLSAAALLFAGLAAWVCLPLARRGPVERGGRAPQLRGAHASVEPPGYRGTTGSPQCGHGTPSGWSPGR